MWERVESIGYNLHPPILRALIAWYRSLIEECLQKLTPANLAVAIEIASLPDQIRGYEKIKSDSIAMVKARASEKLALMDAVQIPVLK